MLVGGRVNASIRMWRSHNKDRFGLSEPCFPADVVESLGKQRLGDVFIVEGYPF